MKILERVRRFVRRTAPTGDLTNRIVKSAVWVLGQNAVGRAVQLLMLLVLARLIGPGEIGLMGIALLSLSALKKFTSVGLNSALIQNEQDDVDDYLNTTWLLETGRGVLIFAVLFAASPLIADFFDAPRAEQLLRVIAVSPILVGLRNPGIVYFQKKLNFHKQFVYRVSGDFLMFAVAVGFALVEPTAWAYVTGFLAADAFRMVVSYAIHGYRPWPSFDRGAAKELLNYGKWITGSSILYFLYSEGDDVFVGWFLAPATLGLYQYAYRFSNAPATELTQVIVSVMFPAYSQVQDDPEALRSSFLKTLRFISLVAFPMAFGIAAVAGTFVRAFLGSEWTGMILAMQILTVYGLLRAIGKTFGAVWKAIDRPDIVTKLSALRVVLVAALIYPATAAWGITGTALTVTAVYVFPMMPIDAYIIVRSVDTSYTALLDEMVYPFVASVVMFGGVWYAQGMLALPSVLKFGVLVALGCLLYGGMALLLETKFDWGVEKMVRQIVASLRS